jgi:hypothetical protein
MQNVTLTVSSRSSMHVETSVFIDAGTNCARFITVTPSDFSLTIEGTNNPGNNTFESKITYDIGVTNTEGWSVYVNYDFRPGSGTPPLDYLFRFVSILEFNSPDQTFNAGDEITSRYDLNSNSTGWDIFSTVTQESHEKATVYEWSVRTLDSVFQVQGHISSMVVPNFFPNNQGLSPNFIKFDYFINNFPYVGTGTSLALVGCVASNSEPGTLDAAILISTDTPSYLEGAIIWDTSVTTIREGGASHSETLIATYGADAGRVFCAADEETVYYSIQSADRIVSALWDPTVGVNINAEPPTPTMPSTSTSTSLTTTGTTTAPSDDEFFWMFIIFGLILVIALFFFGGNKIRTSMSFLLFVLVLSVVYAYSLFAMQACLWRTPITIDWRRSRLVSQFYYVGCLQDVVRKNRNFWIFKLERSIFNLFPSCNNKKIKLLIF